MTTENTEERKPWSKQDLIDNLIAGGVKRGDTVVMYSSIMDFGVPELNGEHLCHFYLDALFNVLGEDGILVITAYSYSFCDGNDFDPWTTRSTVNVIANYCIDNGIGVRTIDPVFSYLLVTMHDLRQYEHYQLSNRMPCNAARDFTPFSCLQNCPDAPDHTKKGATNIPKPPESSNYNYLRTLKFTNDCLRYDDPSITAFLLARKARYVMLGWCFFMTFIHNLERRDGSPYRFFKVFKGKIKTKCNGSWQRYGEDYTCYYYVRVFCENTLIDRHKCFQGLLKWPDFDTGPDACVYLPLGPAWMICASLEYMITNIEKSNHEDPLWYCHGPEMTPEEINALKGDELKDEHMDIREYQVADLSDKWIWNRAS